MKNRLFLNFLVIGCLAMLWTCVPTGCASILPPSGGPRDTIAPRLLKISPPDSGLNFNAKEITLTFDEFVDLRDQANNFNFTPTFRNAPDIRAHLKTITIKFNEPLDSGTTYILDLGNAIVDVNEGNPLKNFRYIFSTGPVLDSLEIRGKVVLAETGGIDSTMTVVLHRNLVDSVVRTELPRYVTKLDRSGEFHFSHLPSDSFAIYAMKGSTLYNGGTQLFAFSNNHIAAGKADSIVLYAYSQPATNSQEGGNNSNIPGVGKIASNDRRLRMNLPSAEQDLKSDYVLTFPIPLRSFDSSKMHLSTDTLYTPANFSVTLDSAKQILHIKSAWKEGTKYNLELQKEFAADTTGRQLLKADTLFFTTKKVSDYGDITIRIKNLDSTKNPVLQFIQNEKIVLSASIKTGTFTQTMFNPGEYNIRILYDLNDNGKWDPGKYPDSKSKEKKQPEIVTPIEKTITVKPAWDNQFEISM